MLIVVEGLDGAGKSTQVQMLRDMFTAEGSVVEQIHFPRYDAPVWGDMISRFLRGEFGGADTVNPYMVALLYAGDRMDAASAIRNWMDEGRTVILDRYVLSNVAYQCAKIEGVQERRALEKWILDTEYGHFGVPRPDLSVFLDVPFVFTENSLRSQREGCDRNYLNGASDIHEASLDLQRRVRECYLDFASRDSSLKVVSCASQSGGMLPASEISNRLTKLVTSVTGLSFGSK